MEVTEITAILTQIMFPNSYQVVFLSESDQNGAIWQRSGLSVTVIFLDISDSLL